MSRRKIIAPPPTSDFDNLPSSLKDAIAAPAQSPLQDVNIIDSPDNHNVDNVDTCQFNIQPIRNFAISVSMGLATIFVLSCLF